jgi:site-specific recombinase XerD
MMLTRRRFYGCGRHTGERDCLRFRPVEKAAPATINQRLVAVTRFFRWATIKGVCWENPAEQVGSIRLESRQPKSLKVNALRRLLRAAHEYARDPPSFLLLKETSD